MTNSMTNTSMYNTNIINSFTIAILIITCCFNLFLII